MDLWIIFDIVVALIFIIIVCNSIKKGFIKASYSILSIILTIVLMMTFQNTICEYIRTSPVGKSIEEKVLTIVSDSVNITPENSLENEIALPQFIKNFTKDYDDKILSVKDDIINDTAKTLTISIISVLSLIILYILIRLILFLLLKVLNIVFSLPVLNSVNKLGGALIGVVNSLFLVYILCTLLFLFTPSKHTQTVNTAISNTYITHYFYDNNLLLKLFLK